MRTIKFRVWDKANGRFIWLFSESVLKNIFSQSHSDEPQDVRQGRLFNRNDSEYELSQFTGLYDRNGKEIYEGDIVDYDAATKRNTAVVSFGILHDSCCRHIGFGMHPKSEYSKTDLNNLHLIRLVGWDLKVIGNIYENPELLNN